MRVLFIVKKRTGYCREHDHGYSYCDTLGGLFNSARFVVDMLVAHGVTAELVQVVDNNDIDREVTRFAPDIVVIEALWVVPSKFTVLTQLHPHVQWIVRIHSEIPFLSLEGVAVEWINDYVRLPNVSVGSNSVRATRDIRAIVRADGLFMDRKVHFLPNWYPPDLRPTPVVKDPCHLNVGCFGAIRPFKNQFIQALAAIEFANQRGQRLRFHVNGERCEQLGDNVLRNMRALFAGTPHKLVEHGWETHDDFLQTIAGMDVSMAVSFSESFNIVSADAVTAGVPIVASAEVAWASSFTFADTTSVPSIMDTLDRVLSIPFKWWIKGSNLRGLAKYDRASEKAWLHYLANPI